jgi:hypothetical protein
MPATKISSAVEAFLAEGPLQLFIGGQWRPASQADTQLDIGAKATGRGANVSVRLRPHGFEAAARGMLAGCKRNHAYLRAPSAEIIPLEFQCGPGASDPW